MCFDTASFASKTSSIQAQKLLRKIVKRTECYLFRKTEEPR